MMTPTAALTVDVVMVFYLFVLLAIGWLAARRTARA